MFSINTKTLQINTSEGVDFTLVLASPVVRFLAWLVDIGIITIMLKLISIIVNILLLLSSDLANAVSIILYFVISIGYCIFTEWYWKGQTIGKKIVRLRVVDDQGLKLQLNQIIIRNLLRIVDFLPLFYCVGGIFCLFSRKYQRLGDIAANTVVIRLPKLTQPEIEDIVMGKYNSFNEFPHLEAQLRQKVSPDEARLAVQALKRRKFFEPEKRASLFKEIAEHFKNKVRFPYETVSGLSDERYVINVVETIWRQRL